jgi:hypothetical protein
MTQQSRSPITKPPRRKTGARTSPLQATMVKPEQALSIKPFGLDVKVLLTTEATGGAISVLMGWLKPGDGRPTTSISTRKKYFSSSRAPMR